MLRDLLLRAPAETITLAWLMDRLGGRSFGLMLLLLGLMATLPGASVVFGVLIAVLAFQMILARHAPVLPRFLAARSFKTQRLAAMLDYAVPPLRYMEKYIRPRWQAPFGSARPLVGVAIMLVGSLLFAPIPLSNVPVLSALAPDGSTSLHEVSTHSGGCEDMEGNRCLPHVLPAPCRDGNMLTHPRPATKEVAQLVVASAIACR